MGSALTTTGNKPGTPGRPVSTGYDTDALSQRFRAADSMGSGITPNAHPELANGPQFGNPIEQIGGWINKLFGGNRQKPVRK